MIYKININPLYIFILTISLFPYRIALADTSPPMITKFDFSPKTINVSSGAASIDVSLTLSDATGLSVTSKPQVHFSSPSGVDYGVVLDIDASGRSLGTLTLPANAASGTYNLNFIFVSDSLGNDKFYHIDDVNVLGFPTTLQVISATPDIHPPVITAFGFTPQTIDISSGPATINVSLRLDDVSGIEDSQVHYKSPTGVDYWMILSHDATGLASGTLTIPTSAELGIFNLNFIAALDSVGNVKFYRANDVAALGFPTTLNVVKDPEIPPTTYSYRYPIYDGAATLSCSSPVNVSQGNLCNVTNSTYSCFISLGISPSASHSTYCVVKPAVGSNFTYISGCLGIYDEGVYSTPNIENECTISGSLKGSVVKSLTVAIDGTGCGTVNSNPTEIACISGSNADCVGNFPEGSYVSLLQIPDSNSTFKNWSGACTGTGDCMVTMDESKSVTATFTKAPQIRNQRSSLGYSRLEDAYSSALDGDTLQIRDIILTENFETSNEKNLSIMGGYNAEFSSHVGYTVIDGVINISKGAIVVDGLIVK